MRTMRWQGKYLPGTGAPICLRGGAPVTTSGHCQFVVRGIAAANGGKGRPKGLEEGDSG